MLSSSRIIASPIARKLARDAGQSLESVFGVLDGVGSGPNNRLIQNDIVKALSLLNGRQQSRVEAVAPTPEAIVSPSSIVSYEMDAHEGFLSSLLERSKRSVPHYYLSVDLSLSNLLALRQRLKQTSAQISVTDFILKAAALSMKHVPDVNASWMDTHIRRHEEVNINMFLNEMGHTRVAFVHDVVRKGLSEIADEQINSDSASNKFQMGTFSIHDLGMFGVKSASPIVLCPQACSLGLGAITEQVVPADSSSGWQVAPTMTATLSCDHRVVDGAVAAEWLAVFKKLVEQPEQMLL